jgi:hypothetical protein
MTYREWITATAQRFAIGKADVELILFNQKELIPNAGAEADITIARTVLCKEFANLIPIMSTVSEGGYSISWNWNAIKFWYLQTCKELGLTPIDIDKERTKIRNGSNVW